MAVIYRVSQATSYIRELLDYNDVLSDIWIEGEVSNLRRPGSGHSYFSLRDSDGSLRCVLFRSSRGREHLRDGAAVVAHGRISIYETRGDLQLIADIIQPEGVGELQMELERLTLQLEREGLFDPSRKRPLPDSRSVSAWSPLPAARYGMTFRASCRAAGRWRNCCWLPPWFRATGPPPR